MLSHAVTVVSLVYSWRVNQQSSVHLCRQACVGT